jgi:hypothetical protein
VVEGGLGDTARRFETAFGAGAGDAVSRLSVDDLFIDEYGLCVARRLPFTLDETPPICFSISRAAAAGFGGFAAA